jgi:hypothetical protein
MPFFAVILRYNLSSLNSNEINFERLQVIEKEEFIATNLLKKSI